MSNLAFRQALFFSPKKHTDFPFIRWKVHNFLRYTGAAAPGISPSDATTRESELHGPQTLWQKNGERKTILLPSPKVFFPFRCRANKRETVCIIPFPFPSLSPLCGCSFAFLKRRRRGCSKHTAQYPGWEKEKGTDWSDVASISPNLKGFFLQKR